MYKPLPNSLTIHPSTIHHLGIFAKKKIPVGTNFGMTHLQFGKNLIRTPLGGFLNHSDNPNCKLVESTKLFQFNSDIKSSTLFLLIKNLITIKEIEKNDEITCEYTLYDIDSS